MTFRLKLSIPDKWNINIAEMAIILSASNDSNVESVSFILNIIYIHLSRDIAVRSCHNSSANIGALWDTSDTFW